MSHRRRLERLEARNRDTEPGVTVELDRRIGQLIAEAERNGIDWEEVFRTLDPPTPSLALST